MSGGTVVLAIVLGFAGYLAMPGCDVIAADLLKTLRALSSIGFGSYGLGAVAPSGTDPRTRASSGKSGTPRAAL